MSNLTQKDLLQEGFLDVVRASGRALGRGAVKAVGGAVGGAVGAATGMAARVGRDVLNADTSASIFGVAGQGIQGAKAGGKIGANIATKAQESITGREEAALRKELETNYDDVFQKISINIRRGQPDPTNRNILIIPFTARKIGNSTLMSPDPSIATGNTMSVTGTPPMTPFIRDIINRDQMLSGNLSGAVTTPPSRSQTLGMNSLSAGPSRFMNPLTQFFTNLKDSKQGLFFGYVQKTNNKDKPYDITIRDLQEQIISSTKQKDIVLPKLDVLLTKIPQFRPNNANPVQWATALKVVFNKGKIEDYRKIIDAAVPAALNNNTYILTAADVAALRKALKDDHMLISEKSSQINLLKQLKFLSNSYNKTYELSKH